MIIKAINKIENTNNEEISIKQNWFYEKTNTINKSLVRLLRKRQKSQIIIIRNQKGNQILDANRWLKNIMNNFSNTVKFSSIF